MLVTNRITHYCMHEAKIYWLIVFAKESLFMHKYRLDDGFEVSTGFRSPRKPMF